MTEVRGAATSEATLLRGGLAHASRRSVPGKASHSRPSSPSTRRRFQVLEESRGGRQWDRARARSGGT